ncbi:hypothetical protein GA0115261_104361, partial [Streptomyces sp. OspMP-M43]
MESDDRYGAAGQGWGADRGGEDGPVPPPPPSRAPAVGP